MIAATTSVPPEVVSRQSRQLGSPAAPVLQCAESILECVGQTPLVRMRRYLDQRGVDLLIKLEAANPGGSAKDRPALQMLREAVHHGLVDASTTVIESSSGNMGIGLAQVCRYYGLRFLCVVDPHAQPQNVAIMRALGAEVSPVTECVDGSFLAARLQRVRELLESHSNSYWPNQYANRQTDIARIGNDSRD
jgi:N-(2-amino-2-carboxyethyl)-L-glutamate synthase